MPHGLPRWAYSSGARRHPLELNQAANVVTEVHHPNLEPRPRDADGAHDLAAHRALLVAEYVLDTGAHLRARRVRRLLALCQRTIACGAPVVRALWALCRRTIAGAPRLIRLCKPFSSRPASIWTER